MTYDPLSQDVKHFLLHAEWEALDCDGDGVTNGQEILDGTNPLDPCDLVVANQDTTSNYKNGIDLDCDGDGSD